MEMLSRNYRTMRSRRI